jgi:CubicO group peptidase (beta-lactamase class C family)
MTSLKNLSKMMVMGSAILVLICGLSACGGGASNSETALEPPAEFSASDYLMQQQFVGTALVVRNNQVIVDQAYGMADIATQLPMSTSTKLRLGSITKMITAQAIVKLKQQGFVASFDDAYQTYVPEYPHSDVTIRHMLRNMSGIPDYIGLVDKTEYVEAEELAEGLATLELKFTPGTEFDYSNSNWSLLGYMIERLTNQSYFDYVQQSVLNPLGMLNTEYGSSIIEGDSYAKGYFDYNKQQAAEFADMSLPYAAGALVSNTSDMSIFAEAILNNALFDEAEQAEIFPLDEDDGTLGNGYFLYSFGFFITKIKDQYVFSHSGGIDGFSTNLAILPEQEGYIILLSNDEQEMSLHAFTETLIKELF